MGIHDGHRERLRELCLHGGFEALSEPQKLELLLTYAIPRRDVSPIAHALLKQFGSYSAVLSAVPAELMKVDGVGESAAVLLSVISPAASYGRAQRTKEKKLLDSTAKVGEFLIPYFENNVEESAYLIFLDAKCRLILCRKLEDGELNTVDISVRRIVELALQHKAVMVVLAHNHVSGVCTPSGDDRKTTEKVAEVLKALGVTLVDHVIVAGAGYYSMQEHGEMP